VLFQQQKKERQLEQGTRWRTPSSGEPAKQITTVAVYEVAIDRVQTLTGCIENSPEEREIARH